MFADLLRAKLAGICELSAAQIEQLQGHYELLVRWNKAFNLTTVREEAEVVERHYCESLFLGTHLPAGRFRIADVGSGAGFPGLPVAVLRPECEVALIESNQKKAVFLRESSRGMANVRVLPQRAEEVGERFDWVVSRGVRYQEAVGTLRNLAPMAALLIGDVHPEDMPGFEWGLPIRLPWGERRFLVVSRGTEEGEPQMNADERR